jgi:hypothetical protein
MGPHLTRGIDSCRLRRYEADPRRGEGVRRTATGPFGPSDEEEIGVCDARRCAGATSFPVQVHGGVRRELEGLADVDEVLRLVRELDRVLGADLGARDVEATAVEHHVSVAHELARLTLAEGEPEPQDDRVEAGLELADHLLARDAGLAGGLVVVTAHLALAHAVDGAELLLLEEADLVLGDALAAPAVLARWVGSLTSRAVGAPTEGLPNPAACPMTWSDFVHRSGHEVTNDPVNRPSEHGR